MNKNTIKIRKFLSLILRHQPQSINISLDSEGWADLNLLIKNANQIAKFSPPLTRDKIQTVVDTNDKKRFELSTDGERIRAVQGHSTEQVNRSYEPKIPPDILYHGTAKHSLDSILRDGLLPQQRHHVHLSADIHTAKKVGIRHGRLVILQIDTTAMHAQGFKFYQAENGVWLTDNVEPKFLTVYEGIVI